MGGCNSGDSNKGTPLFDRGDFSDWHRVKVRKPIGSEKPSLFYDLQSLRDSTELVLHGERIGFLTTPGFFSTWMNNADNSSRVTINQALIVALGKSFSGEIVNNFTPEALDPEHAAPETECYSCHQTLDPMRNFYRASFTNFYGQQRDTDLTGLLAQFAFDDVSAEGNGIADLAQFLQGTPRSRTLGPTALLLANSAAW